MTSSSSSSSSSSSFILLQIEGSGVYLGAQNVTLEKGGAFTGEMSSTMSDSLGVPHVIIGHS